MTKATSDMPTSSITCPNGDEACPIHEELGQIRVELNQLHEQVRTDYLSGLFNKRHMLDALEQELERSRRSAQATSLILFDVDHFKQINDQFGHVNGDKVIEAIGRELNLSVRKIDIPCRYGGEEFCVILPSTPLLVGVQVAERIREAMQSATVLLEDGNEVNFSVSLGVDCYTPNMKDTAESFLNRVDSYLYQAKDQGRNRVCHAVHKIPSSTISSEERDALFDNPED